MDKNIQDKSFKGCNLTNADFSNTDIKGADFTDAILTNAIFSFTKSGLQKHQAFLLVSCFLILSLFSGYLLALGGVPLVRSLAYKDINLAKIIAGITTSISVIAFFVITLRRGFVLGICSALLALMPTLILSITPPIQNASTIALGFYNGLEALSLIATGLAIIAISISGVAITLESLPVAILGTSMIAILAALTVKRNEVVPFTAIISLIGHYIAWITLAGDKNFAWIRSIAVAFAAWRGTSFKRADLTDADFTKANLKNTDFREANVTRTCWYKAKRLELARFGDTILINPVVRDLLVNKEVKNNQSLAGLNLKGANLVGADLRGADLTGSDLSDATLEGAKLERAILIGTNLKGANLTEADFSYANLKEADLTEANLQQACLEWTNLTNALAVGTNFTQAKLTGACLGEIWNIDSTTKLEEVECKFYYVLEQPKPGTDDRDRQPASGEFAPGDFTKLHTKIRDTVQILLRNGANHPEAFFRGFKKLMEENPEIDASSIQGFQRKDNDILLDIGVPEGTEKAKIHSDFLEAYEARLEAQKQTALLESEIRHSKNVTEIIGLLASRSIINEVNVTAESKAMNESNDQSRKIEIGSVGRDFNASGQALNLGNIDISGTVTNTIGQLQESDAPEAPQLAELLKQLQTAIEAETNLTDKNKEKALKQVKALAEAAQNPKAEEKQDLAETAITMLKGIVTGLPSAATLIEACTKIAALLGLA